MNQMISVPRIRPISLADLSDVVALAESAGSGFITFPKDPKLMEKKIARSQDSFQKAVTHPYDETYLFVLELLPEKKVVGISGILSRIGSLKPFFYYKIAAIEQRSSTLNLTQDIQLLEFCKEKKRPSEICSLFLDFQYRHHDFGYLLSLSRFLFMKMHPRRFSSHIVAELRGYFDKKEHSPFWDAIGRRFFHMDFEEANLLRIAHPQCIDELFPHHPIYTTLLPKEAQECIGKTHPETMGAVSLLRKQGFEFNFHIDLFEAGPHFSNSIDNVFACQESRILKISKVVEQLESDEKAMISSIESQMMATLGAVVISDNLEILIDRRTAQILNVEQGDFVCVLKDYKKAKTKN